MRDHVIVCLEYLFFRAVLNFLLNFGTVPTLWFVFHFIIWNSIIRIVNLLDISLRNREMTLDEYEPTVIKDKTNINNDKATYWHYNIVKLRFNSLCGQLPVWYTLVIIKTFIPILVCTNSFL